MQKQSNRTSELKSHIWDSWTGEDGTIGKSYGYQIGQETKEFDNQVQYVFETLKKDPSNRQCVINMWNVSELAEMNLVPCCYSSVWNIINGRLNCMLVQRSADYPVGVPFDTTQYAILTHLFARHLGVKPGLLTHVMADSHIYQNQINGVLLQISQYDEVRTIRKPFPKLVFKDDAPTNFWQMTLDDFDIVDYEPMPAIKYEVAV
jgi:thymidylate synthase